MDTAPRTVVVQQDKLSNFINSLPKEVRKERKQAIEELQGSLSKSMRTIRDLTTYCPASGRASLASTAASSGGRSSGRSGARSARQLRGSGSPSDASFRPPPRRGALQSTPSQPPYASRTPPGSQMARTPPGSEMARPPQRWTPSASVDSLALASARGGSRPSGRGAGPRPGSASSASSSVYSGASTPIAGRTWGHLTRVFGNGIGRTHYDMKNHFYEGYVAENDGPGLHGHSLDDDMQSGIERCVGHGRRFLGGAKCHMHGGQPRMECAPGLHGHYKGDDFQGGIERYVGSGKAKFDRRHHHRHHITDDWETDPGEPSIPRSADCEAGPPVAGNCPNRVRGKKQIAPNHSAETWRDTPKLSARTDGGHSHCTADYRAAGMSSRDIEIHSMARDPRRQGTHQDRRHHRLQNA